MAKGKDNGGVASSSSGASPSNGGFVAEPALLFHMVTSIMVFMSVQDFLAEQACLVNMGYSEEVCTAIKSR